MSLYIHTVSGMVALPLLVLAAKQFAVGAVVGHNEHLWLDRIKEFHLPDSCMAFSKFRNCIPRHRVCRHAYRGIATSYKCFYTCTSSSQDRGLLYSYKLGFSSWGTCIVGCSLFQLPYMDSDLLHKRQNIYNTPLGFQKNFSHSSVLFDGLDRLLAFYLPKTLCCEKVHTRTFLDESTWVVGVTHHNAWAAMPKRQTKQFNSLYSDSGLKLL